MREGSETPEEGEGAKEDSLETFRREVSEKGAEGVDGETLEEWRKGLADMDDGQESGGQIGDSDNRNAEVSNVSSEPGEDQAEEDGEVNGCATPGGELDREEGKEVKQDEPGKQVTKQDEGEKHNSESAPSDQNASHDELESGVITDLASATSEREPKEEYTEADSNRDSIKAKPSESESAEKSTSPQSEILAQPEPEKTVDFEPETKPIQIESTNLARNDNQILVTEHTRPGQDRGPQVETQSLYHSQDSASGNLEVGSHGQRPLKADSSTSLHSEQGAPPNAIDRTAHVEESGHSKVLQVSQYGGGEALRIAKGIIPEHEERELFGVRVAKVSEPEKDYTLYMMHGPNERRGYLDLYQLCVEKRELVLVKEIAPCSHERFAELYNNSKPKGLENSSLEESGGRLSFRVDNVRVPLAEPSFRTYQAKAILEGKVGSEKLRIVRSTGGTSLRLRDRSLVTSIREAPEGLKVQYTDRHLHDSPHIRYIRLESGRVGGERTREHGMVFDESGLFLERRLGLDSGSVFMRFSEQNRSEAIRYWNLAVGVRERLTHQGDIGEHVAEAALRRSEFRVFQREEYGHSLFHGTHRSERTGPDVVFERDGSFFIGMVKAFSNPHTGLKEAERDVNTFGHNREKREEIESMFKARITGGLAIEVFWPDREGWGAIYSHYVRYGGVE